MDSTKCSGFRKFCRRFHSIGCIWSEYEQYIVLAFSQGNPKQQRRSKKNSNVEDSGQLCYWPVVKSVYKSQNAQFGIIMVIKHYKFNRFVKTLALGSHITAFVSHKQKRVDKIVFR